MAVSVVSRRCVAVPFGLCCLLSLGGLVVGATGPLISNFLPLLVAEVLGERRTAIGAIMAIDNVLLLLLVPLAGAVSDRATASGKGRLRFVVSGLSLAAAGMAVLPSSARLGIAGLIGAIVVLNTGLNVQRSPFQALVADLVPSRYRSYATGSVTLLMCIGAILFLMLGQTLGMRPAFYIAAGTVAAIALLYAVRLGEPESHAPAQEVRLASLVDAAWSALRGVHPGMRAIFAAAFFVQLTFQTFTPWFALHATERFGLPAEQVTAGFIAWAIGGVLGAVPAGVLGVRIGRNALMAASS
jgi:MFS family permease